MDEKLKILELVRDGKVNPEHHLKMPLSSLLS